MRLTIFFLLLSFTASAQAIEWPIGTPNKATTIVITKATDYVKLEIKGTPAINKWIKASDLGVSLCPACPTCPPPIDCSKWSDFLVRGQVIAQLTDENARLKAELDRAIAAAAEKERQYTEFVHAIKAERAKWKTITIQVPVDTIR